MLSGYSAVVQEETQNAASTYPLEYNFSRYLDNSHFSSRMAQRVAGLYWVFLMTEIGVIIGLNFELL